MAARCDPWCVPVLWNPADASCGHGGQSPTLATVNWKRASLSAGPIRWATAGGILPTALSLALLRA
ncbi:MAG: hypothetical protein ACKOJF_10385, partial [Planctomycetaceae bacterium]